MMEKQIQSKKGYPGCAQSSAGRPKSVRRATLLSSRDPSFMTVQDLRASVLRDGVRDHSYLATSAVRDHPEYRTIPHQMPKIKQVIATYPAMKFPRWHRQRPTEEPIPVPDQPLPPPPAFVCRDCTTTTCPSNASLSLPESPLRSPPPGHTSIPMDIKSKGKIMTFCDRCTMTVTLNHTAVDTNDATKSILKKCENMKSETNKIEIRNDNRENEMDFEEAVRDMDDYKPPYQPEVPKKDCMKCKIRMALKCFSPLCKSCTSDDDTRRRVMFDRNAHCRTFEDESDFDACIYDFDECSCRSTAACQASETYIPHAHRRRSRYHEHCLDEPTRDCRTPSPAAAPGGCGSRKLCSNFDRLHAKCVHCPHAAIKSSTPCETKCVSLQARPLSGAPSMCDMDDRYSRGQNRARPCPYQSYGSRAHSPCMWVPNPLHANAHAHTRKYSNRQIYGAPPACYKRRY